MKKIKSFTLAEVLITLVIIGIIAAITVPVIMANAQKQETISKLKKVYSTISQATKRAIIDNGPADEWINDPKYVDTGLNQDYYFNTYIKPYYNVEDCFGQTPKCGYTEDSVWTKLDGTTEEVHYYGPLAHAFMLSDGTYISLHIDGGPETCPNQGRVCGYYPQYYVDINGPKGPNKYGRDVFVFDIESPEGLIGNQYDEEDCKRGTTGYGCSTKLMKDNWEFKDDYPW